MNYYENLSQYSHIDILLALYCIFKQLICVHTHKHIHQCSTWIDNHSEYSESVTFSLVRIQLETAHASI